MIRAVTAALFLAYFVLSSACRSHPEIRRLVDSLTAGGTLAVSDTMPVIDTANRIENRFRRIGKSAIPYLIDAIDRSETGWVGFVEEQSSTMRLNAGAYTGIKAAYMIEYLMSDSSEFQIYHTGVICRLNQLGIFWDPLTYVDVKVVKKLYRSWWDANKEKSMEELKKEWREGKRALNKSQYAWV